MGKKIMNPKPPYEYELTLHIGRILATQDARFDTRIPKTKLGFKEIQQLTKSELADGEVTEEGKVTGEKGKGKAKEKIPSTDRIRVTERTDTKSLLCHCFMRTNGNGKKDGKLYEPLGGSYGHVKRTLRDAAKAIKLANYKRPAIELIRFKPEIVCLGDDKDVTLTMVLEPRRFGRTRELVAYETIHDRKVKMKMLVSRTSPLTGKEIEALLTALKDYDGFGASKRGWNDKIELADHKTPEPD